MQPHNHDVIQEPGAAPIKLWTRGVPLEDEARKQLQNIAKLPFIHRWIAVMPDVHLGKGATVDRKSTRLNSSHLKLSRMPSSA